MEEEILLSLSMITTPGAAAYAHEDMQYFEITSFQITGKGNLRMYVEEAGGTTPHIQAKRKSTSPTAEQGKETMFYYLFFQNS